MRCSRKKQVIIGQIEKDSEKEEPVWGFNEMNHGRQRDDTPDIRSRMRGGKGAQGASAEAMSPQRLQIWSAREWRAAVGREARCDSLLRWCVVRAVDSPIPFTNCKDRQPQPLGGPADGWDHLLGGCNDNEEEEVRVGLLLSGGMKTMVLTVLCQLNEDAVLS